jgi:hypothetical protein
MGDSEGHPVSSEERGVSPDEDGEWWLNLPMPYME